jgi:polyhydroxyalkanoate synthesis regulator protein
MVPLPDVEPTSPTYLLEEEQEQQRELLDQLCQRSTAIEAQMAVGLQNQQAMQDELRRLTAQMKGLQQKMRWTDYNSRCR